MITGGPMIETAKDRIMEPVRRVATSRKYILDYSDAICNSGVAKDFEFGTNLEQFDFFAPIAGLRHSASTRIAPRSADGASRRVSRGASSGETTSAGAVNSQRTLHAAKATDDDGIPTLRRQRVGYIPSLCLPPSDSGISLYGHGEEKMLKGNRGDIYKQYINSLEWIHLKKTMPGEKICLACETHRKLHLHHMYYTPDIWETKHCHCCWLCHRCHEVFHRAKPKGFDNIMQMTWEQLRRETRKVIRRKLWLKTVQRVREDEMEAYRSAMDRDF